MKVRETWDGRLVDRSLPSDPIVDGIIKRKEARERWAALTGWHVREEDATSGMSDWEFTKVMFERIQKHWGRELVDPNE